MERRALAALAFLFMSGWLLAAAPSASASYEAWASFPNVQLDGGALIKIQVIYSEEYSLDSGRPGGGGDRPNSDFERTDLKRLGGAHIQLLWDGQPLTDASGGLVCNDLITSSGGIDAGEAVCIATGSGFYSIPPGGGAPRKLTEWPRCGVLSAKLISSPNEPRVKALHTPSAMVCPPSASSGGIFKLLSGAMLGGNLMVTLCLPMVLILGLLVSSMYYKGKDPMALFDITTPRLPAMRKIRMKPTAQPWHLAAKGRMADRIIGRTEKAMGSALYALYRKRGKDDPRSRLKALLSRGKAGFLPLKVPAAHGSAQEYEKSMCELQNLVALSGATKAEQERSMRLLMDLMQVREALLLDKKTHGYARTGDRGLTAKLNLTIDKASQILAKPWKLIPGVRNREWTERLPGIPYVERTGLVVTGWLTNRAGNVSMRQQLRRTAIAETKVALGLAKRTDEGVAKHLFDSRKIGNIPFIVDKLRNETYVLGKAIIDEHLRALITAAVLRREGVVDGKTKFVLSQAQMSDILGMVDKANKAANGNPLRMRHELAEMLLRYIKEHNIAQAAFVDAAGNALGAEEHRKLLEQSRDHIRKAIKIMEDDKYMVSGKLAADFNAPDVAKMNPKDVFDRYNLMTGMLQTYDRTAIEGARTGRVPMIYLGHDLAELIGRSVAARAGAGQLSEGDRMFAIRQHMETELMRRRLFDHIMGAPVYDSTKSRQTELAAIGANGKVNREWLKGLQSSISINSLRSEMDFGRRGEWAARNYLTGYNANSAGYSVEAERNKIEMIRQKLNWAIGGGQESLLRNYWTQIDRNQTIYLTMEKMSKFYTGKEWNAKTYQEWKEQGVRFSDVQKGVWIIGGERSLVPVPSAVLRDREGRILDVRYDKDANGRVLYNTRTETIARMDKQLGKEVFTHGAFSALLLSEYADRPVNLTHLYKTADGKFKPGAPMDRETQILSQQLKVAWGELSSPYYGRQANVQGMTDNEMAAAALSGRSLSRPLIWENIRTIENRLADHVKMVPRSSLKDDPTQTAWTRNMSRITQGMERVMRGGVHDTDERLHAWYAAQAYARIVMQSFEQEFKKGTYYSDEVAISLDAKKKLKELRAEQMNLLSTPGLDATGQNRLNELRAQINAQMKDVEQKMNSSFQYQKETGYDRNIKRVADLNIPWYNVNEQVNMRDPRIAFGGGYAMGAAMMVGYQTGQFVAERPQMWAGYNLFPGDALLNMASRPSWYASMVFGMHTRPFFTKMTGYTTVYHQDPERGPLTSGHEPGIAAGFQSLFRPSQSMDWLTRISLVPIFRPKSAYRDEFGYNFREESNWGGYRYNFPITFMRGMGGSSGGSDSPHEIDARRYELKGIDVARYKSQTGPGMNYRQEYFRAEEREWGRYQDPASLSRDIATLKARLSGLSDSTERQMLKYQIDNLQDVYNTNRKLWSVPGVGAFFRQGYYGVENRGGYDIAAIGGEHRPWEMLSAYHKNIGPGVPVPGMLYRDYNDDWQLFPRMARTINNPTLTPISNIYDRYLENKKDRPEYERNALSAFKRLESMPQNLGEDPTKHMARDLFRDALRDTYRRETPLLSKFMDLDAQRQQWSFQNSEYTIPLAPLYLGLYHIFRHSSAWARKQSWNQDTPRDSDYGKELSASEKAAEAESRSRLRNAQVEGQISYKCPVHGINIPTPLACPVCRSQDALAQEREARSFEAKMSKRAENLKSWAMSSLSLGENLPGYYMHYQDQAHCQMHGVGYKRGTSCPLCIRASIENNPSALDRMRQAQDMLKRYDKNIESISRRKDLSEIDRGRRIQELADKREKELQDRGMEFQRDKRMGFHAGRAYIKAEQERIKKKEAESGFTMESD